MKKNSNILKDLATFVGKALLAGVGIYLMALVVVNINQIIDQLFSPTSGLIATIIFVAIALVIVGFAFCYFTLYHPAQDEASTQRAILESELKDRDMKLANHEEWIAYYKCLVSEEKEQKDQSSRRDPAASIMAVLNDRELADTDEENESTLQTSDEE